MQQCFVLEAGWILTWSYRVLAVTSDDAHHRHHRQKIKLCFSVSVQTCRARPLESRHHLAYIYKHTCTYMCIGLFIKQSTETQHGAAGRAFTPHTPSSPYTFIAYVSKAKGNKKEKGRLQMRFAFCNPELCYFCGCYTNPHCRPTEDPPAELPHPLAERIIRKENCW